MTGGWALDHARPKRVKSPWPLALGFLGRGQAHGPRPLGLWRLGPGHWACNCQFNWQVAVMYIYTYTYIHICHSFPCAFAEAFPVRMWYLCHTKECAANRDGCCSYSKTYVKNTHGRSGATLATISWKVALRKRKLNNYIIGKKEVVFLFYYIIIEFPFPQRHFSRNSSQRSTRAPVSVFNICFTIWIATVPIRNTTFVVFWWISFYLINTSSYCSLIKFSLVSHRIMWLNLKLKGSVLPADPTNWNKCKIPTGILNNASY